MSISFIFLIVALVLFGVATFNVPSKFNLIAAGLFFSTLAAVVAGGLVLHG